jgi:hypothetical protein
MSGSPGKIVPEVNLDEFEKRLRAAGAPSAGSEDPLAELTRLVNSVHADARRAARTPQSEAAQAEGEPAMTLPPAFGADLPSGFAETETETDDVAESSPRQGSGFSDHAPARRSRGWGFKVTGMIVVGVALLAGAAALKHGVPGLPKAPPFIAADDAPTKVQPPNEANVQSSGDVAALLMKDSATPTPVKVVNTEEQPVDLRTQTQPPTPSASAGPPGAVGPAPPLAVDPGSPVATAPETQIVPPAAASASVAPLFPGAKPVKTVSVRPDGTLIAAADASAAAAAPAPDIVPTPPAKVAVRAVNPVVATPEAATPKLDLPTKLSPKSQQRVIAKTDTTAPNADASATPSAPLQLVASPKPKPVKPAPKTVAEASVADSPTAAAAPIVTASAPIAPAAVTAPAAAEGGGGWAVQLAAPRSEADAHSAVTKLKSKYADALGDSALSIHQADVKGETIYRVRVSGLSRADAGALCSKLKAGGGDCFIAKD